MNMDPEWHAVAADFAMRTEKETEVFLVKEMGISWCAPSASWCQEHQKIFNSQKGFNNLMNLLYKTSQKTASKGFRKSFCLLARTTYLLGFSYFLGYDRSLLSDAIWG